MFKVSGIYIKIFIYKWGGKLYPIFYIDPSKKRQLEILSCIQQTSTQEPQWFYDVFF